MSSITDHRRPTCGRLPKKPHSSNETAKEKNQVQDELSSWDMEIDLLELRAYLGEKALESQRIENEESRQGQKELMTRLNADLELLRLSKVEMTNVPHQNAMKIMRTCREYQLATSNKTSEEILNWLEDIAFDLRKEIDEIDEDFEMERLRLAELWEKIQYREKYPYPGAEPSEQEHFTLLFNKSVAIANKHALKEILKLIQIKYLEIESQLKDDQRTYPGKITTIEKSLEETIIDGKSMEQVLDRSYKFRDAAHIRYKVLKVQYFANRALRRSHVKSMKKWALKSINARGLQRWKRTVQNATANSEPFLDEDNQVIAPEDDQEEGFKDHYNSCVETLKYIIAVCKEYEKIGRQLLETLEVSELGQIHRQIAVARQTRDALTEESSLLAERKFNLLTNEYNLLLIHDALRYSGQSRIENQNQEIGLRLEEIKETETDAQPLQRKLNEQASTEMNIILGSIGTLDAFNLGRCKSHRPAKVSAVNFMEEIVEKLGKLMTDIKDLEEVTENKITIDNYPDQYKGLVILPPTKKFCRLIKKVNQNEDNQDDDDDSDDEIAIKELEGSMDTTSIYEKVLEAKDIKAKSKQICVSGRSKR